GRRRPATTAPHGPTGPGGTPPHIGHPARPGPGAGATTTGYDRSARPDRTRRHSPAHRAPRGTGPRCGGDDDRLRLVRTARELLAPSPQHPSPTAADRPCGRRDGRGGAGYVAPAVPRHPLPLVG
ncbi:hypothetical protein ABK046_32580, partial [Streptomyces caeruleatus]